MLVGLFCQTLLSFNLFVQFNMFTLIWFILGLFMFQWSFRVTSADSVCNPPCSGSFTCTKYYGQDICASNEAVQDKCDPPCGRMEDCRETLDGDLICAATRGRQSSQLSFCDASPCVHGECEDVKNQGEIYSFTCNCEPDWVGLICDRAKNEACTPNPCQNNCTCKPSCKHELGYQCVNSEEGYIGKNCDIAVPDVECTANEIVVKISKAFYDVFDGAVLNSEMYISKTPNLASEISCIGRFNPNDNKFHFAISLPFVDECGTSSELEPTTGGIGFTNQVWINRMMSGLSMPVPVLNFTCVYARNYGVVTALNPLVQLRSPSLVKFSRFKAYGDLCKVNSCPQECPSLYKVNKAAVFTIGETIHYTIYIKVEEGSTPISNSIATLDSLFLSCSDDMNKPGFAYLINEATKCPNAEGLVNNVKSGKAGSVRPLSVCVSFEVPKPFNCDVFHIHTKLRLCSLDASTIVTCPTDSQVEHCFNDPARVKRSVNHGFEDSSTSYSVIGPIRVIEGSPGRWSEQLFLDKNLEDVITLQEKPNRTLATPFPVTQATSTIQKSENILMYAFGAATLAVSCLIVLSLALNKCCCPPADDMELALTDRQINK